MDVAIIINNEVFGNGSLVHGKLNSKNSSANCINLLYAYVCEFIYVWICVSIEKL